MLLLQYWCTGPGGPHWPQTFVQRPAADSRLLFWLASIHGVDGMLHPAINDWVSRCSQSKKLVRGYPHCRIVRRINDTMLTDWDPVDYPDFRTTGRPEPRPTPAARPRTSGSTRASTGRWPACG